MMDLRFHATDEEIKARTEVILRAKIAKARTDPPGHLTDDELDLILPPVDCFFTRLRLARRSRRATTHAQP